MARKLSTDKRFRALNQRIVQCQACSRLVEHCRKVAVEKRASYRDDIYHGKPVVNFGSSTARLLIVGLAPGAHGANRTGRMFTGDRSGDFLYRAMYETGFANQPTSLQVDDGLELKDAVITAAAHCAPPGNKPTRDELANCEPFFLSTFDGMPNLQVVIGLGKIAHDAVLGLYKSKGAIDRMSAYPFSHGSEHNLDSLSDRRPLTLLGSYHPSQQNTFTGKLTQSMLQAVFKRAGVIMEGVN